MPTRRAPNPGAETLAQWVRATSLICRNRDAAKGLCSRSADAETLAAVEIVRNTPATKRAEFAREQGSRRGKYKNPEEVVSKAEQLYEAFHGKPSDTVTVVEEPVYSHRNMADLGELRELQVIIDSGQYLATIGTADTGIRLAAAGVKRDDDGTIIGTELHFVGGDQTQDLETLKASQQAGKPYAVLGELFKVVYYTSKHFHNFRPSEYIHELGEDSGIRPLLCYDVRSQHLFAVGGNYTIRPEGIVD